ncbi:hypothetical protein B0H10DRAFT_1964126 [Mycena sp. CBHHK59/15]|nr:hypothetical protein B0H10DRAFT_1964126 [Mycena sp. CBHHK59/15]
MWVRMLESLTRADAPRQHRVSVKRWGICKANMNEVCTGSECHPRTGLTGTHQNYGHLDLHAREQRSFRDMLGHSTGQWTQSEKKRLEDRVQRADERTHAHRGEEHSHVREEEPLWLHAVYPSVTRICMHIRQIQATRRRRKKTHPTAESPITPRSLTTKSYVGKGREMRIVKGVLCELGFGLLASCATWALVWLWFGFGVGVGGCFGFASLGYVGGSMGWESPVGILDASL